MQNLPAVADRPAPPSLAPLRKSLDTAKNDTERDNIRRAASAAEAAARALNLPAVQCEASAIVRLSERALVKANPAKPAGERRSGEKPAYQATTVKAPLMSQLRSLHSPLSDNEFEQALEEARAAGTPPTRKFVADYARRLRPPETAPESETDSAVACEPDTDEPTDNPAPSAGESPEKEPAPLEEPDDGESPKPDNPPQRDALFARCAVQTCIAPAVVWGVGADKDAPAVCVKHFLEFKTSYQGVFVKAKSSDLRLALEEAHAAGVSEGMARAQKAPPETTETADPKITVDPPPKARSTRRAPRAVQKPPPVR